MDHPIGWKYSMEQQAGASGLSSGERTMLRSGGTLAPLCTAVTSVGSIKAVERRPLLRKSASRALHPAFARSPTRKSHAAARSSAAVRVAAT